MFEGRKGVDEGRAESEMQQGTAVQKADAGALKQYSHPDGAHRACDIQGSPVREVPLT